MFCSDLNPRVLDRTLRCLASMLQTSFYEVPISYPIRTSVLLPSHPRVPAAESMYLQVGSIWSADMTPARGGPGTIKNGTVECLKAAVSLRSYRRKIS